MFGLEFGFVFGFVFVFEFVFGFVFVFVLRANLLLPHRQSHHHHHGESQEQEQQKSDAPSGVGKRCHGHNCYLVVALKEPHPGQLL